MTQKLELYKEYERQGLRGRLIIQGADVEKEMIRIEQDHISKLTVADIPRGYTIAKLKSFLHTQNAI